MELAWRGGVLRYWGETISVASISIVVYLSMRGRGRAVQGVVAIRGEVMWEADVWERIGKSNELVQLSYTVR